jgi:predicted transcriptional regulator
MGQSGMSNLFSKEVNFLLDSCYPCGIWAEEVKNMGTISFAVKLSEDVRKKLKAFCDERGLKIGAFVEKALKEQMEREEMIEDAKEFALLRHEQPHAIDYKDYLKERRGKEKKKARV